ncbi:MAG: DUF4296 domain-containing protein [Bacteroidales bacterium]|nr:DUF4296 domain-containing protein [Bacteroidales bacterium]
MKNKSFLLLIFILIMINVLFDCSKKESIRQDSPPIDVKIIPPDTMELLMRDMYLTESYIRWSSAKGNNPADVSYFFYKLLLTKYHLDTHRVNASIKFYIAHEDQWIKILTRIINEEFSDVEIKPDQNQPF